MEWTVDWSNKISPDQIAINAFLQGETADKRILHVGIGNSSLARQATDARLIIGTSVIAEEIDFARSLRLPNYIPCFVDKHSENMMEHLELDIIVDNNPFAFCRDEKDLYTILDTYAMILKKGGKIVSHDKGIIWNFTKINPEGIDLDDNQNYRLTTVEKIIRASGLKFNYFRNGVITIEE